MGKKIWTGRAAAMASGCLAAMLLAAVLFGGCGSEKKAATMHLVQTAGTVGVQDENEKEVSLVENLGLYSGYQVGTRSESYAWIDLDQAKLAKMDQDSEIGIRKSENGKELEIDVQSGSMFFHVTEPLAEDESMEIQTSTMIAGVRGTCGFMQRGSDFSMLGLLEGRVECQAVGGGSVLLEAGQAAFLPDGDTEIQVFPLETAEIPDFVRQEAPELVERLAAMEMENEAETETETEAVEETLYDPEAGLEPAEIYEDGIDRLVVEVADGEDLMALARSGDLSNKELRLGDGDYEVDSLVLYDYENLSIIGTGNTRLVVNNGYELILEAIDCRNLLLHGLTMGHELIPEGSGCTVGVLYFDHCEDVRLGNCDIYGCGLVGISGMESNITAVSTVIRDCSRNAVYWIDGEGMLRFEKCAFSGNGKEAPEYPLFETDSPEAAFVLEDCIMQNNANEIKYQGAASAWNESGTKETGNGWQ